MRDFAEARALTLMPGDVRDYLIDHPDFLSSNPDLLGVLTPPRQRMDDDVRDFQRFMLAHLQDGIGKLKDERDHALYILEQHMHRQSRMNVAGLSIMEAPGFQAMLSVIEDDLPLLLDHAAVEIMVEDGGEPLPGIRLVHQGFINEWLPNREVILEGDIHGVPEIFADRAPRVHSQAFVRLQISSETAPALLAFGHRDKSYYLGGLATEQITHLASVIEICARGWLDLEV